MLVNLLNHLKRILNFVPLPFYVLALTACAVTGAYLQSRPAPVANRFVPHANHTASGATTVANTASPAAAQDSSAGGSTAPGTGHTTTGRTAAPGNLPNLANSLSQSYQITASPAQLTLDVNSGTGVVYISSATNKPFSAPFVSAPNGLFVTVSQVVSGPGGDPGKQLASWQLNVHSIDRSSGGQATFNVTTIAGQVQVPVKWFPVPAISVANTRVTSATGSSTITYTVSFTLVANSSVPTVPSSVYIGLESWGCTNRGDLARSVTFSGGSQNYTIDCIMDIPPPYVPGSGYPPALGSGGFSGTVYVTVTPPSGWFIQSPAPFSVSAP